MVMFIVIYLVLGLLVLNFYNQKYPENKKIDSKNILQRLLVMLFWLPLLVIVVLYLLIVKGSYY